jgi:hypothetical protein
VPTIFDLKQKVPAISRVKPDHLLSAEPWNMRFHGGSKRKPPSPFQVQHSRIFSSFHARKIFISWVNAVLVLIIFNCSEIGSGRRCRCRLSPVLGAGNGTACRRRAREAAQRRRGTYGRTCHARGSASACTLNPKAQVVLSQIH